MARKPPNQSQYSRLSLCGHHANADKSQLHGEKHKEMTETNSRYYGLSLLLKCGHTFLPPSATFHLCFLSQYSCSGHVLEYFFKNPDWHNIKNQATLQKRKKWHKVYDRPLLCKGVNKWLYCTAFLELTIISGYYDTLQSKSLDRFL